MTTGLGFDAAEIVGTELEQIFETVNVVDARIDVFGQRALLRMRHGDAGAQTDSADMLAAVKSGQLAGIYKEDERVPALRARKMNLGWWQLIPRGEDAALVLDPVNFSAPPIIVFRDAARSNRVRLDPALRKAWAVYKLRRDGRIARCPTAAPPVVASVGGSLIRSAGIRPIANLMPPILCQTGKPSAPLRTLTVATQFPYPWGGNGTPATQLELRHMSNSGSPKAGGYEYWEPSTVDFKAVSGAKITVNSFLNFLRLIARQEPGSISRINLISHANMSAIGFRGRIDFKVDENVLFDDMLGSMDLQAGTALEQKVETLRDRFADGAEIFLFMCHAGVNVAFLRDIANAFRVTVKGFRDEIVYCPLFMQLPNSKGFKLVSRNRVGMGSCDNSTVGPDILRLIPDIVARPKSPPPAPEISLPSAAWT